MLAGWHRLRRCSRACPLPQGLRQLSGFALNGQVNAGVQVQRGPKAGAVPVGAGVPAKQAMRCMTPAAPVFAGLPAPTGIEAAIRFCVERSGQCRCTGKAWTQSRRGTCGSGRAREAGYAVYGTGCAGVRGLARSYRECGSYQILR